MNMMRALLSTLVLAAAAAAGTVERAEAIESYLKKTDVERLDLTGERSLLAPATGGVLGWFVPQVFAWLPKIEGDMSTNGDTIDFSDDIGLDDSEVTIMPQVQFSLGPVGVRISAFFLEFTGDETVTASFEFGGSTFIVSERIQSRVEINNYRAVSLFKVAGTGFLTLSIQSGISFFQIEGSIEGETTGSAREKLNVPIPVAGLLVQAKFGRFVFEVDVVGLSLDISGTSVTLLDIQASVGVTFFKILGVRAGYKRLTFDGDSDDIAIDLTIEGFFIGGSLQF